MKAALFWEDVLEISGSCKELLSASVSSRDSHNPASLSVLWEKLRVSEESSNFSNGSIGPKPRLLRTLYSIITSKHRKDTVLGLGNREGPLLSFSRLDFKSLHI